MRVQFFSWARRVLSELCGRPDHLQRLAVVGAGVIMWPTLVGFALVVWLGYARTPELQSQSLNFMGMALLASMALWGLVVVATLGIIKGLTISGPAGMAVSIETTANEPCAPEPTFDTYTHS